MVGVCLTMIGIIRAVISLRRPDIFGDDLFAINAMLYLAACLVSYWAATCIVIIDWNAVRMCFFSSH